MHKEQKMTGCDSKIDPRAFLILDDCLYDDKWTRNTLMRNIFFNGRHMQLLVLITSQYPLGMPPTLRTNIDYTFILQENNLSNRKKLYENYAGMFPTFEMFCQVMDQCTENFQCLVINNNSLSNKLVDQVFWYKADLSKTNYRIGADIFWDTQPEEEDDSDGEEKFNEATYVHKRKGPRLNVKKT